MSWGVIEGFYGKPWSAAERKDLFERLAAAGLDAYFFAPKDDPLHRARWRELYPPDELAPLRALVEAAHARGIAFWYGLAPGLDLVHSDASDRRALLAKLSQLKSVGVDGLALLFDDIPATLHPDDARRFGTLAAAQADVAREALQALGGSFLFCPTEYCGVMSRGLASPYLAELGRALPPEVQVFWTGPDIISLELTVEHLREVAGVLGRKPVIWDNLFANDYDMRRVHLGPFAGRPLAVRDEVAGLFLNPNCEHEANAVALHTFGAWRHARAWDTDAAYEAALRAWLPRWDGAGISLEDLRLFCDAYHLPGGFGATTREWLAHLERLTTCPPEQWGASEAAFLGAAERLFAFSDRIASLHHRPLLHAVLRHGWELKEELHILRGWVAWRKAHSAGEPFFHPHARPPIYKGALLTRLRGVLDMAADGGLIPRRT